MRRLLMTVIMATVFLAQALQGVIPQKWETRSKDDFLKGKFDGISVSYEGILSLSPKEEKLEGPAEEFYLSLLVTAEDVIYLGTGHSGKIYRISKGGAAEFYFQVPEMDIYCLAQDKKGNLYAGTSPNGKIWKITDKGKGEPFFDPREKYIWDLMFNEKGSLLAAVGESGGIYEINQEGEGSLIFKAVENHILCMRFDPNGDIIAGSGGKGLLYRIPQGKKASVIFESPYEEIKSIVLDGEGNIYLAAGGAIVTPKKEEITPLPAKTETEVTVSVSAVPTATAEIPSSGLSQKQPGALYRINPQGIAKRLWNSDEELVYSLLWNEEEKRLVFGTGNQGRVYAVDKEEKVSLLIQKKSEQVYGLFPSRSRIYMLANNPSSLSLILPQQVLSGEYLSRVMDTKTISSWGNIEWQAEIPSGTTLLLQSRSGNSSEPNESWSDWSPPYQKKDGEKILSPKSRYVQFKANFRTQSGRVSPLLQRVSLFFLQTNIPPAITELKLLAPNEVYLKPPEQEEVIWGLDTDVAEQAKSKDKDRDKIMTLALAKKAQRKGFQTVTWEAEDENGDSLLFSIQIRREDESQWRLLREKWTETAYAFDTASFADGVYFLKIIASDSPSNPSAMDLKSEKISEPLVIDNSLPLIKNFQAVREKDKLVVTFQVEDSLSSIEEVKYLIRPEEWKSIFPEDGICDSKQESFKISLALLPGSDSLITIRAKDSHANVGVFRQTF